MPSPIPKPVHPVVAMVRMHRSIGTATPRRRIPKSRYPKMVETAYGAELAKIIDAGRDAVKPLLEQVPALIASAQAARGDAADFDARDSDACRTLSVEDFRAALAEHDSGPISVRADANEGAKARALMDEARRKFADAIHPSQVENLASKFFSRTANVQGTLLKRQAKAALGIDIGFADKKLPALLDQFVAQNVSLIRSLANRSLDDIEKLVTRAISTGQRAESIEDDISDRFDIAERHARLIARDQIGKGTASITNARQQEIGVTKFYWDDCGDERVRGAPDGKYPDAEPSHREYTERSHEEGGWDIDDPPTEDGELPGQPINCRCGQTPVFDDILDQIDAGDFDDVDDSSDAAAPEPDDDA